MAERRMFSKKIIQSARFLRMPISTQALYFHLGLSADDDGVVEAWNVLKLTGVNEDDLKVLVSKGFLIPLNEDLVSYLTDWNEHNTIRSDRKKNSIYKELLVRVVPELAEKNPVSEVANVIEYSDETCERACICQADDNQTSTNCPQDDRIGKDRLTKVNIIYSNIITMYNDTCVSLQKCTILSDRRKKALSARLKTYTIDDFTLLFEKAAASSFLSGRNGKDWQANFDWLIKDANMAKVLDGNYDDYPDYNKKEPVIAGGKNEVEDY